MPTPIRFAGNQPALTPSQPEPQNQSYITQNASPYYYWQNQLSRIPTGQFASYVQPFGDEVLPVLAPRMAAATPLISSAFAGYTVYDTFRKEYRNARALPPDKRYKKLAIKAGDLTLFHLFASLLIPALMTKKIHASVERGARTGCLPKLMAKNPRLTTAFAVGGAAVLISKPVNKAVNFVMDWTYRPLVEKHKRKKWEKLYREQFSACSARMAALRQSQA